jgi:hypothetical protein
MKGVNKGGVKQDNSDFHRWVKQDMGQSLAATKQQRRPVPAAAVLWVFLARKVACTVSVKERFPILGLQTFWPP